MFPVLVLCCVCWGRDSWVHGALTGMCTCPVRVVAWERGLVLEVPSKPVGMITCLSLPCLGLLLQAKVLWTITVTGF